MAPSKLCQLLPAKPSESISDSCNPTPTTTYRFPGNRAAVRNHPILTRNGKIVDSKRNVMTMSFEHSLQLRRACELTSLAKLLCKGAILRRGGLVNNQPQTALGMTKTLKNRRFAKSETGKLAITLAIDVAVLRRSKPVGRDAASRRPQKSTPKTLQTKAA